MKGDKNIPGGASAEIIHSAPASSLAGCISRRASPFLQGLGQARTGSPISPLARVHSWKLIGYCNYFKAIFEVDLIIEEIIKVGLLLLARIYVHRFY
jgi:hypothetical protein